MELRYRRLDAAATAPARAHDDDAGFDLFASEAAFLGPGERAAVAPASPWPSPRGTPAWCCRGRDWPASTA